MKRQSKPEVGQHSQKRQHETDILQTQHLEVVRDGIAEKGSDSLWWTGRKEDAGGDTAAPFMGLRCGTSASHPQELASVLPTGSATVSAGSEQDAVSDRPTHIFYENSAPWCVARHRSWVVRCSEGQQAA